MDKYNNNNTISSISVKCAGTGGAGLTQRFWNYFRKPGRKVAGSPVVMLVTPEKKQSRKFEKLAIPAFVGFCGVCNPPKISPS